MDTLSRTPEACARLIAAVRADYADFAAAVRADSRALLADLRADCAAAGITASSPADLGPEDERLAREERWT